MSWLIPLSMMLHLLMKAHPRVRAINWMRKHMILVRRRSVIFRRLGVHPQILFNPLLCKTKLSRAASWVIVHLLSCSRLSHWLSLRCSGRRHRNQSLFHQSKALLQSWATKSLGLMIWRKRLKKFILWGCFATNYTFLLGNIISIYLQMMHTRWYVRPVRRKLQQ